MSRGGFLVVLAWLASGCQVAGTIDGGVCAAGTMSGVECTTEREVCRTSTTCLSCGAAGYILTQVDCGCSEGHWFCTLPRTCTATSTGVFVDSQCTVPSVGDAGAVDADAVVVDASATDAIDTVDVPDTAAIDACGAGFDVVEASTDGCAGGRAACGGSCVDLASDPRNCGACGLACSPAQICSAGSCICECSAGHTACRTACNACLCVDLATDSAHCGGCGVACAAGEVCSNGLCTTR